MMILMNWYENILKFEYIEVVINVFIREKFLRLTMGFGYFMYSHSLVPVIDLWVRVVTQIKHYLKHQKWIKHKKISINT